MRATVAGRSLRLELRRQLEQRVFPAYFVQSLVRSYLAGRRAVHGVLARGRGRPLGALDPTGRRSGDTLFVMGSGASIHELTPKAWEVISASDSLGFNFWLVHDFVPTFYVLEAPRQADRLQDLLHNLAVRASDYAHTPVIMKDPWLAHAPIVAARLPAPLGERFYVALQVDVPGTTPAGVERSLRYLDGCGRMEPDGSLHLLFHKRATLSFAVFFGLKAGYRNIVLCGVDLRDAAYFYDQDPSPYVRRGLRVPRTVSAGHLHPTMDPALGRDTIDTVLAAAHRTVLKPRGVTLYVGSRTSALHPMLPCYFDG